MVNVNNYGVSNTTGYNPVTNTNQRNNQPVANTGGNNQRVNDTFDSQKTSMPSGRVPTVGMWDKMNVYFKDVLNSPQNLAAYKTFETAMKSNPQGYLQPDSSDTGKIKDLQQKFSYLGMNIAVNGRFGSATEQAVIRFKKSVGINDGYLDKNGNMAVTPIVTPKMWSLLNAQVANKQNPNANPTSTGYVAPVTPEELNWAKQLMTKVKQYGYKPNQTEKQRYDSIFQRQQAGGGVPQSNGVSGSQPAQRINPPSQQDLNWAKQMAVKIQQYGYKPTSQEVQKYQSVYKQLQAAKSQPQAPQFDSNGVSQQDMAWATSLMNKIKGGYRPNAQEAAKYQEIYNRSNPTASTQQTQQTGNTPVTQDEMAWAQQLESRVTQGYNPTQEERAKYDSIYNRSQGQPAATTTNQPASTGVSAEDLAWAQQLENKVNTQGYQPTQQELAKYKEVYEKSQAQGATTPAAPVQKPTDREIQWALELERKTKEDNYQPTQTESAIYDDIAKRLNASQQAEQQKGKGVGNASADELAWASQMFAKMQTGYTPTSQEMGMLNRIQQKASGAAATTQQTPTPKPQAEVETTEPDNTQATNFNAVTEFAYNSQTINAFKSAFPGVSFKGNNVPYLPDGVAKQVAKKYGFGSVSELQSAVGAGVDGRFGPETFFRLNAASNGQLSNPQSNAPVSKPTSTQTTSSPQNGVTQEELDWAVNLQSKYSTGYKPTAQEQQKYTDIFNRYEKSGQNIVDNSSAQTEQPASMPASDYQPSSVPSNVPTVGVDVANGDQELQWALDLLNKVQQQGYTPSDDEVAKYEQIIAKNQSVVSQ